MTAPAEDLLAILADVEKAGGVHVQVDFVISESEIDTLTDAVWHFATETEEGRALHERVFGQVFAGGTVNVGSDKAEEALSEIIDGYAKFNRLRRATREKYPELAVVKGLDVKVWYNDPAFRSHLLSLLKRLADRYFLAHEQLGRIRPRARRPGTRVHARVTRRRQRRRNRQVRRPNSIYNRIVWSELSKINTRALIAKLDDRAQWFLEQAEATVEPNRSIAFKPVRGNLHNRNNGYIALHVNGHPVATIDSPPEGVITGAELADAVVKLLRRVSERK